MHPSQNPNPSIQFPLRKPIPDPNPPQRSEFGAHRAATPEPRIPRHITPQNLNGEILGFRRWPHAPTRVWIERRGGAGGDWSETIAGEKRSASGEWLWRRENKTRHNTEAKVRERQRERQWRFSRLLVLLWTDLRASGSGRGEDHEPYKVVTGPWLRLRREGEGGYGYEGWGFILLGAPH